MLASVFRAVYPGPIPCRKRVYRKQQQRRDQCCFVWSALQRRRFCSRRRELKCLALVHKTAHVRAIRRPFWWALQRPGLIGPTLRAHTIDSWDETTNLRDEIRKGSKMLGCGSMSCRRSLAGCCTDFRKRLGIHYKRSMFPAASLITLHTLRWLRVLRHANLQCDLTKTLSTTVEQSHLSVCSHAICGQSSHHPLRARNSGLTIGATRGSLPRLFQTSEWGRRP